MSVDKPTPADPKVYQDRATGKITISGWGKDRYTHAGRGEGKP